MIAAEPDLTDWCAVTDVLHRWHFGADGACAYSYSCASPTPTTSSRSPYIERLTTPRPPTATFGADHVSRRARRCRCSAQFRGLPCSSGKATRTTWSYMATATAAAVARRQRQ